ncbi:MAG: hypothetical protein WCY49_04985 [Anaerovoracaceae bacterium]|nr:hypothetical protein [Clostridiales bacterium]
MKRVFGYVEGIFNVAYLITAFVIGLVLLVNSQGEHVRILAGIMALVLAIGDGFHLVPRVMVILTGEEERLRKALGRGKEITSITMTFFYFILWYIGLMVFSIDEGNIWTYVVYGLATARILLCIRPENKWEERYPPLNWGIYRNIPFFLQGMIVAGFFYIERTVFPGLSYMWLAILLSFVFYLPVVLFSNKNPKVGMLMLPKTAAYVWMLVMCLSL